MANTSDRGAVARASCDEEAEVAMQVKSRNVFRMISQEVLRYATPCRCGDGCHDNSSEMCEGTES